MRFPLLFPFLVLITGFRLFAEPPPPDSAYGALRLLPRGEAKKVARIEARDGTPVPERWYILVHDPKEENGVHEYVVAGGEVVASRSVSQFAQSLRADDVYGGEPMRTDSDRAATVARAYGEANNVAIASMNYELKKDGTGAALLWTVTCFGEDGKEIGRVVLTAGRGNIVSHEGFTSEPPGMVAERLRTQAGAELAANSRARGRSKTDAATPQSRQSANGAEPERKPDFFQRVGGSLHKFFTGRDPNRN